MAIIRCENCGHVLGEDHAGMYVMRHRQREVLAERVLAIRCERCGEFWRADRAQTASPPDPKILLTTGRAAF